MLHLIFTKILLCVCILTVFSNSVTIIVLQSLSSIATDRYQPGYGQGGLLYTYQMDEDISEFQLVDTSKPQKVSTYKNKQKIQVSSFVFTNYCLLQQL